MFNAKALELEISDVAIAYRDNLSKNNIDFAKESFETISKMEKCLRIVGDFSNFFDNLEHAYLKKMLCNLLNVSKLPNDYYAVYKNITMYSSIDWKRLVEASGEKITKKGIRTKLNKKSTIITKKQFIDNKQYIQKDKNRLNGIPQGSPTSAVLSNIYMMDFDVSINKYVKEYNGKYMRYSDDFLIVIPYSFDKVEEQKKYIFNEVKKINGLKLQKEKTHIFIYDSGVFTDELYNKNVSLDYLGFIFDGKNIKIRSKSITKYYYRMNRKARNIGMANWKSPKGKRITAKNLYKIYSSSKGKNSQTFIDYGTQAIKKMQLNDHDLNCLIKNHKHKINMAIKRANSDISKKK